MRTFGRLQAKYTIREGLHVSLMEKKVMSQRKKWTSMSKIQATWTDEDETSNVERKFSNSRFLDEDDGNEWEEQIVIRRIPKRRENYSSMNERSAALPRDGSLLMEMPSPSRSSYYHNSSQQRYSSHRPSSASPSRRNRHPSFYPRHTSRQEEPQK
ncbi:hypothetical protein COOONC_01071 [Cooperia oncophora]